MNLTNPDFVMLARSYGAYAERVETTAGFADAWQRATASGMAAVLELIVNRDQLNPRVSVSKLRAAAPRKTNAQTNA
jgi:acetolactate synthase I/II/III large subunit